MKKYRTIVADPPWPYDDNPLPGFGAGRLSTFLPYETLGLEQLAALPLRALAEPAAHVYLWTTNRYIWSASELLARWGAGRPQVLVWCKAPMGLGPGGAFANTAEFVLFARGGVGASIQVAREAAGSGGRTCTAPSSRDDSPRGSSTAGNTTTACPRPSTGIGCASCSPP